MSNARVYVAILLTFAAIGLAAASGGCSKPMSKEEIESLAGNVLASFRENAGVNSEETVFEVEAWAGDGGRLTLLGRTSDAALRDSLLFKMNGAIRAKITDQITVLPAPSMGGKVYGVVKVPVVNLGDGPRSSGGKHTVTQARAGDVLKLLELRDGWYLVQMHDNYLGWISQDDIHIYDKASLDAYWAGNVAVVASKTAPVFREKGTDRLFTVDLVQGSALPVKDGGAVWTRVMLAGGTEGFIETAKVLMYREKSAVFAEKKGADSIIATAKEYLGLPYLWGGTTAYGFDCSGLTQYCYRMNGYQIRRDADMQYEQGEPVKDRKDLLPGDLVFFETYARGASHVGIYIGDSRYIQSGGATGLSILSFDPAHAEYSQSLDEAYLGARRIIH